MPETYSAGLHLPTIFRKKGVRLFEVCVFIRRDTVVRTFLATTGTNKLNTKSVTKNILKSPM